MKKYNPISCSIHDILLDRASRKVKCEILYRENEILKTLNVVIVDVFTLGKEEYLKTDGDVLIRLDQLISVDGIKL